MSTFNNKLKIEPTYWILITVQVSLSKTSKASLHIHVFNTLVHMKNVVPPTGALLIRVSKGGGPRQGGGKTYWLTWGQLPKDHGQGSWCQDV